MNGHRGRAGDGGVEQNPAYGHPPPPPLLFHTANDAMATEVFSRPRRVDGAIAVPGDKSISHRALLFAALAEGVTHVRGASPGDDVQRTASALARLGVAIAADHGAWHVTGLPIGDWVGPTGAIDCGNSGTTMRLLCGALAGAPGLCATLDGDPSLRARPMRRVVDPLAAVGADLACAEGGCPPVQVRGRRLRGGAVRVPVASAQIETALLLAGLHAQAPLRVDLPLPVRDHTARMLVAMGADLRGPATSRTIRPGRLRALGDVQIPADPSAAAFAIALGVLHPDAVVRVAGVGVNPTRTAWIDVLREMGAVIEVDSAGELGHEPTGDLRASTATLRGVAIDAATAALCIDELPILALCAACARGPSTFAGVGELRVKESDRAQAIVRLVGGLGAPVELRGDELRVEGVGGAAQLRAIGAFDPGLDHRMALTAAVAGLAGPFPIAVHGWETTGTSWPGAAGALRGAGTLCSTQ